MLYWTRFSSSFGVWGDCARKPLLLLVLLTGLHLTPYIPKCMTKEQVWLLICAVASMRLSELSSWWPLTCWTVPSKGVILFFILSGTAPVHPLSLLLGPLAPRAVYLIQNQNTLKFLLSSTVESFFLVPSFCWRLEGEKKENNDQENSLLNRRPSPYSQEPIWGSWCLCSGPQCFPLKPTIPRV